MTAVEKAKKLVDEQFYQPITLHLNVNNNSGEMWEYAKRCALITVNEVAEAVCFLSPNTIKYWTEVKKEIEKL